MTEFEGELSPKIFRRSSLDLSDLINDVIRQEEVPQEIRVIDTEREISPLSFFIRVHRVKGVRYVYFEDFNNALLRKKMKELVRGVVKDIEPRGFRVRIDYDY